MRSRLQIVPALLGALLLAVAASRAGAQSTTLFFEGEGIETGVTVPDTCCFSLAGATFLGFQGVFAPGDPALTSSGEFVYRVAGTDLGLIIRFDEPVDSVSFFFVHDASNVAVTGTARLYDGDGNLFAQLESRPSTTRGDPANFVSATSPNAISHMQLFALPAFVDDFTFNRAIVPITTERTWTSMKALYR